MSFEVKAVQSFDALKVCVTLIGAEGEPRSKLTDAGRRQAISLAAPYLNRPGFDRLGNYGYIPTGEDMPISDAAMKVSGSVIEGKGRFVQEFIVSGSP